MIVWLFCLGLLRWFFLFQHTFLVMYLHVSLGRYLLQNFLWLCFSLRYSLCYISTNYVLKLFYLVLFYCQAIHVTHISLCFSTFCSEMQLFFVYLSIGSELRTIFKNTLHGSISIKFSLFSVVWTATVHS